MDPAGVRFDSVEKRYDSSTLALSSLTLEARPGEFLVLLGPSGCGKSTALRIVAGLEKATSGTVSIGDRVVNDVEPKDRDIAMVFQSYALYPHLTVRKNIEFPLRARKVPGSEREQLVADAARSLHLEPLLDRKPGQLSGGQRQRVALARAIVRQPKAYLMDEPLSNLDARLRVEMRAELIELHRRTGTTVMYVTHDQVEAMTMGDRVAILDQGVLQQVGTPADVHAQPANLFVAGFIGSPPMNLLPAEVLNAAVAAVPARSAAGDASGPTAGGGSGVIVGVRPEDLSIDWGGGSIPATVALVESLGHEYHVICRVAAAPDTPVIVRVPASSTVPAVGDEVHLAVRGTVHRFDAATGERMAPATGEQTGA